VDQAVREYGAADFNAAAASLARAQAASDLERADVVQLLLYRALVSLANGDARAVDDALLGLASLEPDYYMSPSIPPVVRQAFARVRASVRGPLALQSTATREPGGVRVHARIAGDVAALVREVRVHARVAGARWQRGHDDVLVVATPGTAVEHYAEAIGPGGAVLASDGSEQAPSRVAPSVLESPRAATSEPPARAGTARLDVAGSEAAAHDARSEGGGAWLWVGIGAGALALAGAIILVVALAPFETDDTQLGMPAVDLP